MPLHPPEKDRTVCFEEDIELAVLADELGFSDLWVGQHHSLAWEPIPANDVFIANVLPRTQNIRLGTGVSILPQHHPVNVAVRIAYLDHLSRGRINCGFGQGGIRTDWALFDLPEPKTQGLMTVEAMDLILKLWQAEAPFEYKGDYWHVKLNDENPDYGIGTILKPYQKPHPPLAMSVVQPTSMAARTAGQRGYIPISTNLVPAAKLCDHWKTYCTGAEEAGRPPPDRAIWQISRSVFIGESNEEAWDHAVNGPMAGAHEYLINLLAPGGRLPLMKHDQDIPDDEVTSEYLLKHLCIIGDVETVTQQLMEVWEQTGGFGTLLMIAHDWDDKAKWVRSMELLAKEVVPRLPTI